MVLGFAAGVALDLAPPADHVAGRWALALSVVAFPAARVRQDVRPTATAVIGTVAAGSFVGTSIFALTGLVLGEGGCGARPAAGHRRRRALGRAPHPVRAAAPDEVLRTTRSAVGHRLMAVTGSQKSRLRLVVVQALVFSLFATLFVRLYYLQVVGGEGYQAMAANQSVRDIVVQPQRGLIVDDQGRPLVANRVSWVVSIDRNVLDKLTDASAPSWSAGSRWRGEKARGVEARLVTCGDEGSVRAPAGTARPTSRCRSRRRQPGRRAADDRAARGLPRRGRRAAERPRLPRPFGINLAHVLGYLSPITYDEFDAAPGRR